MKNFRTLDLAVEFYEKTEALKLKGNLRDQLDRAASSIALNLSEGNAKFSIKEKKRYYKMAYASVKESQTILKLLKIEDKGITTNADHLGASIYKLLQSEISAI